MPLPERVIIDSSAFLALLSKNDTNHTLAVEAYGRLVDREQELWTTSSTLVTIVGFILERFGIESLRVFNDSIKGIIHIFWVDGTPYRDALELILSRSLGNDLDIEGSLTVVAARCLQAHVFGFRKCFSEVGIATLPR
ncbi:MAG: hypothetical protein WB564_08195 [Dehalococcoidia bacterium]